MNKFKIQSRFSGAVESYNAAAKVQLQAIDLTMQCMHQLSIDTDARKRVLDLGSGTGLAAHKIHQQFAGCEYFALDLSLPMLKYARQSCENSYASICADATSLPLQNQRFDLILSNSMFQWCEDLSLAFSECRRILCESGTLVFSTFGPATLKELREAFSIVDTQSHVGQFASINEVRKALDCAGFDQIECHSVLLEQNYKKPIDLLRDLKAVGANYYQNSPDNLYGKTKFLKMLAHYPASSDHQEIYPATYEVIYGTAK